MNKKVLIVDDDRDLASMLSTYLKLKHFEVTTACHSREVPYDLDDVDLIILDINMPGEDGFQVCKQIRKRYNIPILFLSARAGVEDRVEGLMLGGDDYIVKPFSLEELYARIHTNIYRMERLGEKDLVIDFANYAVTYRNQVLLFTRIEFEIIELLARHPKQVFDKERIYEKIWGHDAEGNAQVVSEHIRNIRNKFKEVTDEEYIKTIWGVGYSWNG